MSAEKKQRVPSFLCRTVRKILSIPDKSSSPFRPVQDCLGYLRPVILLLLIYTVEHVITGVAAECPSAINGKFDQCASGTNSTLKQNGKDKTEESYQTILETCRNVQAISNCMSKVIEECRDNYDPKQVADYKNRLDTYRLKFDSICKDVESLKPPEEDSTSIASTLLMPLWIPLCFVLHCIMVL